MKGLTRLAMLLAAGGSLASGVGCAMLDAGSEDAEYRTEYHQNAPMTPSIGVQQPAEVAPGGGMTQPGIHPDTTRR